MRFTWNWYEIYLKLIIISTWNWYEIHLKLIRDNTWGTNATSALHTFPTSPRCPTWQWPQSSHQCPTAKTPQHRSSLHGWPCCWTTRYHTSPSWWPLPWPTGDDVEATPGSCKTNPMVCRKIRYQKHVCHPQKLAKKRCCKHLRYEQNKT